MSLIDLIFKNFLEPFAYLIYATIFFSKLVREKKREQRVLFWYYLVATILMTWASLLVLYPRPDMDNNWIYNTVHFINICVLSWYFYHLLQTKLKKGFVWVALVVNVAVFIVYDLILHRFISTYNGYVYAICYICLVAYSFMYFNQLLNNISEKSILNNFNFWLVSGYLINFLGSFIIILLYRTVDYDDTGNVWAMQNIILFLCSIITFVGYLKTSPRKQYL